MLTMESSLKRLVRPSDPPRFRLTARDVAILAACAQFRFLSSTQIAARVGGSPQQVVRRLQYLFAHAFLDRPPSQFVHLAAFVDGSFPLVYGLSGKGARLLREHGHQAGLDAAHLGQNNRSATAPFLAHTLETAQFVLDAEARCTDAGLAFLDQHRLIATTMPPETQALRDPLRLQVSCLGPNRRPTTIAVIPDRLCSIVRGSERTNYAVEIDRGTERIKNKFSLKHYAYLEAWRQDAFKAQWNFQRMRVLTITTSTARIDNMITAQRAATGETAPGLFLYTTSEKLAAEGLLAPIWKSAKAENVSLLASGS